MFVYVVKINSLIANSGQCACFKLAARGHGAYDLTRSTASFQLDALTDSSVARY